MAISDGHGLPLAVHVASASPHEVTLVDATLAASFLDALPTRLIGDRGYDSDRLDTHLRDTYGIEMIASIARIVASAPKMAGRFAARAAGGTSSDCLPGSTTRVASSLAGNIIEPTFSGCVSSRLAVILLRAFMR